MTESAAQVADRFLKAIYEGDTNLIWELFSDDAQQFVVARGMRKGLSGDLARSLIEGNADQLERSEFLGDLLGGLEKDVETIDLSRTHVDPDHEASGSEARVVFFESFVIEAGPALDPLPVGVVELSRSSGGWRVDRMTPHPPRADP